MTMTIQEEQIRAINPAMHARGEFHREVSSTGEAIMWATRIGIDSFDIDGDFWAISNGEWTYIPVK